MATAVRGAVQYQKNRFIVTCNDKRSEFVTTRGSHGASTYIGRYTAWYYVYWQPPPLFKHLSQVAFCNDKEIYTLRCMYSVICARSTQHTTFNAQFDEKCSNFRKGYFMHYILSQGSAMGWKLASKWQKYRQFVFAQSFLSLTLFSSFFFLSSSVPLPLCFQFCCCFFPLLLSRSLDKFLCEHLLLWYNYIVYLVRV